MPKLIFPEVWEPQSISNCYITMLLIVYYQINVTDLVNESSAGFLLLLLKQQRRIQWLAKAALVQDRIIKSQTKKAQIKYRTWRNCT